MTCAPASPFWLKTTSTTCQSSHSTSTISWTLLSLPTLRLLRCGTRKRWACVAHFIVAYLNFSVLLTVISAHVRRWLIVWFWCCWAAFASVQQRQDYWCRLSSACPVSVHHRAKCSPPYSPRPTSMMSAFTPTQVRMTSAKAWDKIHFMASVQGYTTVTAQETEGSV